MGRGTIHRELGKETLVDRQTEIYGRKIDRRVTKENNKKFLTRKGEESVKERRKKKSGHILYRL